MKVNSRPPPPSLAAVLISSCFDFVGSGLPAVVQGAQCHSLVPRPRAACWWWCWSQWRPAAGLQVGLRAGQENNSDVFYPKYTSSDQHSQPQCSAEGFCPSLLPRGSAHLGVLMLICDFRAMHDLGLRIKAGTLTFRQPSEKGEPLKCLKGGEKAPLSPFDRMASSLPGFSG